MAFMFVSKSEKIQSLSSAGSWCPWCRSSVSLLPRDARVSASEGKSWERTHEPPGRAAVSRGEVDEGA